MWFILRPKENQTNMLVMGALTSPPSVCQAVATQRKEPKHMELIMAGGQALSLCLSPHFTVNLQFDLNLLLLSHLLTGHVLLLLTI